MAVKIGRLFFRKRHILYVPFVLVIFLTNWQASSNLLICYLTGTGLLLMGAVLRFWAVRHCGKRTIYKREKGKWLTLSGPYAFVRNPLYISNILIGCGLIFFSRLVWLIPIFVIIGFIFYHFIVLYEESTLIAQFKDNYRRFLQNVPRWIPRIIPYRGGDEIKLNPWKEVYLAERLRLLAVLVILCLIILRHNY